MSLNGIRRPAALTASLVLLLSACAPEQNTPDTRPDGDALTWTASWTGYDEFLNLAAQTYPDIKLEPTAYAGANRTGYSWAQMRGDDIPDIFYPYVLVTRDGGELEDDRTCRVAFLMGSYTEETEEAYHAQVTAGYVRDILRDWLAEQKVVSPDETRWK